MKTQDIKIGNRVRYDNEVLTIINYFPQIKNTSRSGDVLVEDKDGITELINHNELELITRIKCDICTHKVYSQELEGLIPHCNKDYWGGYCEQDFIEIIEYCPNRDDCKDFENNKLTK